MALMSLLCILGGVFYGYIERYLLTPAAKAVMNVTAYVDKMMGAGTAVGKGLTDTQLTAQSVSVWDPVNWLILFAITLLAVFIVILTGERTRGKLLTTKEENTDGKYATFFGGEKAMHSHVAGSDLFWGFKKDWRGYFRVAEDLHSGDVNDYVSYAVIAAAVLILVVFAVFGLFR